jgi:ketosteroid isomerase-like protein
MSEAATFRNQLDALSIKFVADFDRRNPQACSEAYTEDAVLLLPGAAPVRGRTEIAAAFQAAMDAGREILALTTTQAESDGDIGYAVQTVHGNQGDGTVMLALRRDYDGVWLVCCEAVMG